MFSERYGKTNSPFIPLFQRGINPTISAFSTINLPTHQNSKNHKHHHPGWVCMITFLRASAAGESFPFFLQASERVRMALGWEMTG